MKFIRLTLTALLVQGGAFVGMMWATLLVAGAVWGLWGDYTLTTFGKIWAALATSYLIIGNVKH